MAATGKRKITLTYFGDVGGASPGQAQEISATDNNASPAQTQLVTLAAGDNVLTAPTGGGTPVACTIVKPAGNVTVIKLKGNAADVGVQLHKIDPDTISLDAGVGSIILNAAAQVIGVRLWWT